MIITAVLIAQLDTSVLYQEIEKKLKSVQETIFLLEALPPAKNVRLIGYLTKDLLNVNFANLEQAIEMDDANFVHQVDTALQLDFVHLAKRVL